MSGKEDLRRKTIKFAKENRHDDCLNSNQQKQKKKKKIGHLDQSNRFCGGGQQGLVVMGQIPLSLFFSIGTKEIRLPPSLTGYSLVTWDSVSCQLEFEYIWTLWR